MLYGDRVDIWTVIDKGNASYRDYRVSPACVRSLHGPPPVGASAVLAVYDLRIVRMYGYHDLDEPTLDQHPHEAALRLADAIDHHVGRRPSRSPSSVSSTVVYPGMS